MQIKSDVKKCNLCFEFYLETGKRLSNRHKTKIYNVFVKINEDFFLFGKCYFRKDNNVKVIPNLSSFYVCKTVLEKEAANKIAFQIAQLLLLGK